MTSPGAGRPLLEPVHQPTHHAAPADAGPRSAVPQATPHATRPAGATAMATTLLEQRTAPRRSPLVRALRRAVGADPLTRGALAPYLDAVGQREVGRRLGALRHRAQRSERWSVLHDLPLRADGPVTDGPATDGSRADHVLVGPAGVWLVTALHLPGSRVRAQRSALVVDGHREPHLRRARQRAGDLQRALAGASGVEVPVRAVVVVLGADRLALPVRSGDVAVLRPAVLVRWLRRQPHVLDAATASLLTAAAHRLGQESAAGSHAGGDAGSDEQLATADGFAALHDSVRSADRLRRAWFVALAVVGSTTATTTLAVLTS